MKMSFIKGLFINKICLNEKEIINLSWEDVFYGPCCHNILNDLVGFFLILWRI